MARENFSIGAFYNISKNQANAIKTVGRDSFLSPKTDPAPPPPKGHSPPNFRPMSVVAKWLDGLRYDLVWWYGLGPGDFVLDGHQPPGVAQPLYSRGHN